MKVTAFTREVLAGRREIRDYTKAGWERCPVPLDLINGGRQNHKITDVAISTDGKGVWIKTNLK